jgi:WD40 repeat protein
MQTLELASPVVALAWGPDNQKLVAATEDRKLHWFGQPLPPTQPRPGNELVSHQQTVVDAPVAGMVFSPDNRSVRIAHGSGQLAVWAYAAPGSLRQMNQGGAVYGIAVSRDGKTIVSCGADQNVRVWDGTTGNQRFQMGGHQGAVHAVAISPDESFAVSSGADKTVRLWDIVGGRQLKQLATLEGTMYSVAIHPGGQQVATAGADRKVYLMDMISGAVQRTLEGHTDYIHCVAFNPTGTRLISFGYAGQVRVWDTASGNLVWENRVGRIGNYADYDAKGTSVLFSSGDGAARLVTLPESAR